MKFLDKKVFALHGYAQGINALVWAKLGYAHRLQGFDTEYSDLWSQRWR